MSFDINKFRWAGLSPESGKLKSISGKMRPIFSLFIMWLVAFARLLLIIYCLFVTFFSTVVVCMAMWFSLFYGLNLMQFHDSHHILRWVIIWQWKWRNDCQDGLIWRFLFFGFFSLFSFQFLTNFFWRNRCTVCLSLFSHFLFSCHVFCEFFFFVNGVCHVSFLSLASLLLWIINSQRNAKTAFN